MQVGPLIWLALSYVRVLRLRYEYFSRELTSTDVISFHLFFSLPFSIFNIFFLMFYSFCSLTPIVLALTSLSLSLYFDNFWMSPTKWIEVHIGCASTKVKETKNKLR
jgi:hypothetical protein